MLVFYLFLSPFFSNPWSPTQEASQGGLEGKEEDKTVGSKEEFL